MQSNTIVNQKNQLFTEGLPVKRCTKSKDTNH